MIPAPGHLDETRDSYDAVADSYAELVPPRFASLGPERSLIDLFAALVRADGGGPVLDAGCGPGHVTAYLRGLGLGAFGLDVSPGMVSTARAAHPLLRFQIGTMTALGLADGSLAGVLAWFSIVHTPRAELPVVLGEFARVLRPGGRLVLGFHAGDAVHRKTSGYGGRPMSLDVHRHPPAAVRSLAVAAGLDPLAHRLDAAGPAAVLLHTRAR